MELTRENPVLDHLARPSCSTHWQPTIHLDVSNQNYYIKLYLYYFSSELRVQQSDYYRVSTRHNKTHVDVIGCKIRGLRSHKNKEVHDKSSSSSSHYIQDDGTREVKIFRCEYRVPKETVEELLSWIYLTLPMEHTKLIANVCFRFEVPFQMIFYM